MLLLLKAKLIVFTDSSVLNVCVKRLYIYGNTLPAWSFLIYTSICLKGVDLHWRGFWLRYRNALWIGPTQWLLDTCTYCAGPKHETQTQCAICLQMRTSIFIFKSCSRVCCCEVRARTMVGNPCPLCQQKNPQHFSCVYVKHIKFQLLQCTLVCGYKQTFDFRFVLWKSHVVRCNESRLIC